MATTQNTYTGDNSTVSYSFTFPYLEETDIKVSLDGVVTTAYTLSNATTITFDTAPASGVAIRIYRDTNNDELAATFFAGSAIRAQDLNDDFLQSNYSVQEIKARYVDAQAPVIQGTLDMNGNRIIDLGDPTSDQDAATKFYIDTRLGDIGIPGHTRWRKTATASQTTFSGTGDYGGTLAYTVTREQVYLNGALQQRDIDYTADDGTSIVFSVALTAGDIVDIVCVNNLNASTVADAANINYGSQFTGQTTRTVAAKLADVVSVKDFGIVGDGSTDNTTAYTALAAAVPAGSTIYWSPGIYVGTFKATKALNLIGGPGVTLKAANDTNTTSILWIEGQLGSTSALSVAPTYGDLTLSGVSGLNAGDLVQLHSGMQRPSDSSPVNYELVRMLDSTTVEGQVMATQDGASPTYQVVTPNKNIVISGFNFDLGTSRSTSAVFVRYAENVTVENIYTTGGEGTTVRLDRVYGGQVRNATRIKPSATGSGQGYHVQFLTCKDVHASEIRGVACRHTFDSDSNYFLSLRNCLSHSGVSSDVVMTHNGYGGSHTYENINIFELATNTYGIHTSVQGIPAANVNTQIARDFVINNCKIMRRTAATSQAAAIYFQYATADIQITNCAIHNPTGGSFTNQMAVRFEGPIGGTSRISDIHIQNYDWGLYFGDTLTSITSYPRHYERVNIERINCYFVNTPIYDGYPAGRFFYPIIRDVNIYDSGAINPDFDCLMRISNSHSGETVLNLSQVVSATYTLQNKVVANPNNNYVLFGSADFPGSIGSSLTPASNTLTQTQLLSASGPAGRILNATTVTTVDRGCGIGQRAVWLCNGAVSISDASTVSGTITGSSLDIIEMVWNGSTWSKRAVGTWS